MKGYFIAIIFIVGGMMFGFGKEMTGISFNQRYINQYFQVLFLKSNNKKVLPEIAYLLVRDFHVKERYSTMSDDISYYEISFITIDEKKIILALCQSKNRVNELMELFKQKKNLLIKDYTHKKILKEFQC